MRLPVKVAIARICYGGYEHASIGDWLVSVCLSMFTDQRVVPGGFYSYWIDQMPVTAARNAAVKCAQGVEADYLLTIDYDMWPDNVPGAPPFWNQAFAFAFNHNGPCAVVAPARMKDGTVCVHKALVEADGKKHLFLMSADATKEKQGIECVPATGLGLMLLDMRAFARLKPPYFRFAYRDEYETDIAGGEDAMFTASLTEAGVPVYVAWDCWAGHDKKVVIGKP